MTPLFYTFRDREEILKIFERYCGARLTRIVPHRRLPVRDLRGVRKGRHEFPELLCAEDRRIRSAAYHQPHLAGAYEERWRDFRGGCDCAGVTGPVLRASGVKWDLRKAQPYANYSKFDFEIPIGETATRTTDTWCGWRRCASRCALSSRRLAAFQKARSWASAKVIKPRWAKLPFDRSAEGELGYFIVSDGSTQPYRLRVRPPSFVNLQALDIMVRGC